MRENNNLASWSIRAGAYLIDVIIPLAGFLLFAFGVVSVVFFITSEFAYGITTLGDHDAEPRPGLPVWIIPLILAGAAILIGYFVWWILALRDGQTPGKRIVGIRVVSAYSGETLGWGMMFVREFLVKSMLFSVLGNATLGIAPLLNFLWPLWDADSQALHDKVVSTQVVYN